MWIFFSYLIIPALPPAYNIGIKKQDCGSYYKFQPGKYVLGKVEYSINSDGFRDKEFGEKKGMRIITLGGSSVQALEAENSWSDILEKKLGVEVLNCGIGGSTSAIKSVLLSFMSMYYAFQYEGSISLIGRKFHSSIVKTTQISFEHLLHKLPKGFLIRQDK